jgi:hypothetical protein
MHHGIHLAESTQRCHQHPAFSMAMPSINVPVVTYHEEHEVVYHEDT